MQMNVFLTFDVEIWCKSWATLDSDFPRAYRRYVIGRSRHGDYALPHTLDVLARHGIRAVFFVEPMFAGRFGIEYLARIVELIRGAGQEIQLHLHPEWTDEIASPPVPNVATKRQNLNDYDVAEQTALIDYGLRMLRAAGAQPVTAFRAGSFAANSDTFDALRTNNIAFDSSINPCYAISAPDLQRDRPILYSQQVKGVVEHPISVFRDGFGRLRHAQVGACSSREMQEALASAAIHGYTNFVVLSHNFEMLKPGREDPDFVVVRRFEDLCRHLAANPDVRTVGFGDVASRASQDHEPSHLPQASAPATTGRLAEQAFRRLVGGRVW